MLVLVAALAGCGDNEKGISVLVMTRQTDWMHDSNPVAADALAQLGAARGWTVTVTDDPATFTPDVLARTDVVVFSVTSGDILDDASRAAMEDYFAAGGGFVGIHSASHTEWDWPFYLSNVVPVTFETHPSPYNGAPSNVLPGTLDVLDPADPIMHLVESPWMHDDEFYTFYQRPEDIPALHLRRALDESAMGPDYPDAVRVGFHPLAFTHELSGGRSFYTALGHTSESYSDPVFMLMVQQGIEWAARRHPR